MTSGKVYLMGAGPGNLDYLTLKGYQVLSIADVLIYDDLVDPQLLQLVPSECIQLYMGKRGGSPSTPQDIINLLLVDFCLQGKQVVRLKGGDPFIFGRANPEIESLVASNCDYEVIPGISSALAAPLLAGIPLTDKNLSRCFVVLSGHDPDSLDWEAIALIDTIVILMGGRSLEAIINHLQDKGRSPTTPIAIIRDCARPQQQIWSGTLETIVDQVAEISLSPTVIVIGDVVTLRQMSSSSSLPLSGKTVLVTRSAEQSSKFSDLLQQQGATVIEMPALEITPPSSWEKLDQAIANLGEFDWLILTSANGVNYFFERLGDRGKDARSLAGVKIAVVGKKTAETLKQQGVLADYIPPDFVADSLIDHFPEELKGKKILFPRVETGGREVLVKELGGQGAKVIEVPAYQSGCPQQINPQAWQALQEKMIDIITFASSKTVQNFYYLLQQALTSNSENSPQGLLEKVCIASIGPQTSKTCYEALGRVDIEAQEYTLEGLTDALIQWVNHS
ncbi:uroporphyrin-III C-methyltransferase [Gloeothece citriformis PCC 7424]|uniref:uroporphyrinogen-III C-methyltransferase n=1 Tax=Gloeothece citriformis (strain PCC 7424) TaxID=65393 RepID=B7KK89_GLOC7|nr:uroporphyrinogen-III C-methyltransferase [Gloeothece citriformis]ACK70974.1 uroporphyrin-III C-methyltransferase [Gloeothece citriformis PCC 7424]